MKKLGLPVIAADIESSDYYTNLRRCLAAGLFMQVRERPRGRGEGEAQGEG